MLAKYILIALMICLLVKRDSLKDIFKISVWQISAWIVAAIIWLVINKK